MLIRCDLPIDEKSPTSSPILRGTVGDNYNIIATIRNHWHGRPCIEGFLDFQLKLKLKTLKLATRPYTKTPTNLPKV